MEGEKKCLCGRTMRVVAIGAAYKLYRCKSCGQSCRVDWYSGEQRWYQKEMLK